MRATISFEEDSRLVNELLQLLTREQSNLVMANVDEIEKLLELKSTLLQRINLVARSRYESLAQKHFEANENGMLAWVMQQSNPVMKENWDNFQNTLTQAKEMNRLNGLLITKHFNRNQQMLNNLQNAFKSTDVYGKNGQAKSNNTSRGSLTA